MELKIKRLREEAVLPFYATSGAAGMDLTAVCPGGSITIAPTERALIPTGIAIELPDAGHVALLFARSSLGVKRGLSLPNGVGVIDSDYRGEIHVALVNLSGEPVQIYTGERIAQLVIMPVTQVLPVEVKELGQTQRGEGGFGSTGLTANAAQGETT